jgi:hypothetical protein
MDLHRDVLGCLSPLIPHVAAAGDERAKRLGTSGGHDFDDIVDEWGAQSFPASDPPANW